MSKVYNKKSAAKKNVPTAVKTENFDINKFYVEEFNPELEMNKKGSQYMTFPRYDRTLKNQLCLSTGPIKFTQYGIKKLDGKYITSDEDRAFFKFPLDPDQEGCINFENVCKQIDEKFTDKQFVCAVVGAVLAKNYSKLQYVPLVKEPFEVEDEEEFEDTDKKNKPKVKRMKYVKVKLAVNFETKDLETHVFVRNDNGIPEKVNARTVTELEEHMTWGSTCQFLITAPKVWIAKSLDQQTKIRKFGVSFKCPQLEVIEKRANTNAKQEYGAYAFGGSNDTVEEEEQVEEEQVEEEQVEEGQAEEEEEEQAEEEQEEEQEQEEEEEEQEEEQVEEEEEEQVEEEEVVPPPKSKAKSDPKKQPAKKKN